MASSTFGYLSPSLSGARAILLDAPPDVETELLYVSISSAFSIPTSLSNLSSSVNARAD
ncbi:hypothetical protein DY000_02018219 [Brassica cretica]|uniref:Uncharacterized protein n=1 Tax=Brassica cretica TaxID=69181 RepID=A0ABQ7DEW8_BRACR|nr:hypothetical protein DY000_02018219 [Brassica cretica]